LFISLSILLGGGEYYNRGSYSRRKEACVLITILDRFKKEKTIEIEDKK